MDSSNESQKKIRKVLRSRRICIPIPPKIKQEKLFRKPAIKRSVTDETPDDDRNDTKPKNPFSPKEHNIAEGVGVKLGKSSFPNDGGKLKKSARIEHDKSDDDNGGKSKKALRIEHDKFEDGVGHTKSKIGKSKTKISTTPTDKKKVLKHPTINEESEELSNKSEISFILNGNANDDDSPKTSSTAGNHDEQVYKVQDENVEMEYVHQFEVGDADVNNQFESEEDVENDQENSFDDTEAFTENCIGGILKGFNKDIGTLFLKTSSIESDIKEIKRLLKSRPSQNCSFRSLSSQFKENSAFSLLPKFSLTKKSHVRKMESDAGENEEYKTQMVSTEFNLRKKFGHSKER